MNTCSRSEARDSAELDTPLTGPNEFIARTLEEVARALAAEHADAHRIAAYRKAAQILREMKDSVAELYGRRGQAGLRQVRGIGKSLAETIAALIRTGCLPDSKGLNLKLR